MSVSSSRPILHDRTCEPAGRILVPIRMILISGASSRDHRSRDACACAVHVFRVLASRAPSRRDLNVRATESVGCSRARGNRINNGFTDSTQNAELLGSFWSLVVSPQEVNFPFWGRVRSPQWESAAATRRPPSVIVCSCAQRSQRSCSLARRKNTGDLTCMQIHRVRINLQLPALPEPSVARTLQRQFSTTDWFLSGTGTFARSSKFPEERSNWF